MIQPITKLVTISSVSDLERATLNLDTADGRFSLANRITSDIDEWFKVAFDDGPRNHLGASIVGSECKRHVWYTFRWFKHFVHSGRMQRLFQDGHWYEERFIEVLTGIGCTVSQVSETGEQHRIYAVDGHCGGSSDGVMKLPERYGVVSGERYLAEFKTINTANFGKFHDLQHDKPQHWAQMCAYGYKMGIKYGIYFLVNKNDSNVYVEVVELDWAFGEHLINVADWIIHSQVPPPKLSKNPSDYRCKMCEHHTVCQLNAKPDVNCRSCYFASPIDNKQWFCNHWQAVIPNREAMLAACSAHTFIQG